MFDYNLPEGKKERIADIEELVRKLGSVPGNVLSHTDVHHIQEYLLECKKDLQKQLRPRIAVRSAAYYEAPISIPDPEEEV